MASFDELVARKIKLLETVPESIVTAAEKAQRDAWRKLGPLLAEMDVDATGNIRQTEDNIRRIGLITEELNKVLAGGEYKDAVQSFLSSIDEGVQLTDDIAKKIDSNFQPDNVQKQLLAISKQNAINAFFGSGLRDNVTVPFLEQLTANVAARAPLNQAVKALQGVIEGTETTDGRLLANVRTTANTAQAIADRSYAAAVNEELGIEYFQYLGGEIPTTRPFCEHREGAIFHRKEIEAWGNGENSAGINDISNGTWAGRIDGTDSRSIFTFVGGWNCRHFLVPVIKQKVPPSVIARAEAEGFATPPRPRGGAQALTA
jgi:hypothetical protein